MHVNKNKTDTLLWLASYKIQQKQQQQEQQQKSALSQGVQYVRMLEIENG